MKLRLDPILGCISYSKISQNDYLFLYRVFLIKDNACISCIVITLSPITNELSKAHLAEFRWRNVYGRGTGDETLAVLLEQMAELYPTPGNE